MRHSTILGGVDTGKLCDDPGIGASPWQLILQFGSKFAYEHPIHLGYFQMMYSTDVVTRLCHIAQAKPVMNLRQNRSLEPFLMVESQCWHQFLSLN